LLQKTKSYDLEFEKEENPKYAMQGLKLI